MAIVPLAKAAQAQQTARARERAAPQKEEYPVGYGKPPKASQFKKGESGNPKGRPKRAKGFNSLIREAMHEPMKVRTSRGEKTLTRAQVIIMKAMEAAVKGNFRAADQALRWYQQAVPEAPVEAVHEDGNDFSTADAAIMEGLRAILSAEGGNGAEPAGEGPQ